MIYQYSGEPDTFEPIRAAIEAAGVVVLAAYTTDSIVFVEVEIEIPAEIASANNLTVV